MPVAAQTRVYPLDRLFPTRSTTYIPVGVHPCRRALSPHTGHPVHRGYGPPRRPVPDAVYHLHPCRRALSPHTGLPVHRGYGRPRPLVPDAVYHLHPCRRRPLVPDAVYHLHPCRRPPCCHSGESRNPAGRTGVLQRIPILSDCVMPAETRHCLSFPPGGNVFYKPLDSGFRRNDGKAVCQAFGKGQEQGCREDDRPIPAACSRRGSTARIPVGVQPCRRAAIQACIHAGEARKLWREFTLPQNQ